jgi:hypothetical protein
LEDLKVCLKEWNNSEFGCVENNIKMIAEGIRGVSDFMEAM